MRTDWHERSEGGRILPVVVWTPDTTRLGLSSATLGGGLGQVDWVLNATVASGYDRDDPAAHLESLASTAGLTGRGVGTMTAVDVRGAVHAVDEGVEVWATVGVDEPTWAAAPPLDWHTALPDVGTINVLVELPERLEPGALVNAVATATEAKCQAMADAGLRGTGTPTDAVTVLCPIEGRPAPYGGPRSVWGSRLARAVHRAVADGLAAWAIR